MLLALEAIRDIACEESLQLKLTAEGAAEAISDLPTPRSKYDLFWLQTVSVAAAEALKALCEGQSTIKSIVAQSGAIPQLVELANVYQTYSKGPRWEVVAARDILKLMANYSFQENSNHSVKKDNTIKRILKQDTHLLNQCFHTES